MYTYIHNFKGIAGISFTGKDNSMYSKEPCSLPQNLGLMLIPINNLTMGSSLLYCDYKVPLMTLCLTWRHHQQQERVVLF